MVRNCWSNCDTNIKTFQSNPPRSTSARSVKAVGDHATHSPPAEWKQRRRSLYVRIMECELAHVDIYTWASRSVCQCRSRTPAGPEWCRQYHSCYAVLLSRTDSLVKTVRQKLSYGIIPTSATKVGIGHALTVSSIKKRQTHLWNHPMMRSVYRKSFSDSVLNESMLTLRLSLNWKQTRAILLAI